MPAFRVSYFKLLQSSDGHVFKCLERTVDVDAINPVAALASIDDHGLSLEECDCVEVARLGDEWHPRIQGHQVD